MGSNGNYLKSVEESSEISFTYAFLSDDPNEDGSGYTVEQLEDGYVQIKSFLSGSYWMVVDAPSTPAWILGMTTTKHFDDPEFIFLPVQIDDTTIGLRSMKNNHFCVNDYSSDNRLVASSSSLVKDARIQVMERVLLRKIYDVRYLMEYARIFDNSPFVAGRDVLINDTNQEATLTAEVSYQDEKSHTLSRGVSFTAGVSTSIKCKLAFLVEDKIEVSFEASGNFQWDDTTTTTTQASASAGINVPPMSTSVVEYVGTQGTCNIPYTYTQEDQSSVDGRISRMDQIDGIYNGVSYYNFNFHVISNEPIQS